MRARRIESQPAPTPADCTPPAPVFLPVGEVAELLHVSVATVRRWVVKGDLPRPLRIGKTVLWNQAELFEALARRTGGPGSPTVR